MNRFVSSFLIPGALIFSFALFQIPDASADLVGLSGISYVGTESEESVFTLDDETNIIDGSGLSGAVSSEADFLTVTHASASAGDVAWATVDPGAAGGDFFLDTTGTVVFDLTLDGLYSVDTLAAWGYHFGGTNGNSISTINLEFSTNGGTSFDSSQTVGVALTGASATVSAFTAANANFIRMTVTDNHFGAGASEGGGDRVGIAELRFAGVAIPEPGSFVLLGSFGALVVVSRRRIL